VGIRDNFPLTINNSEKNREGNPRPWADDAYFIPIGKNLTKIIQKDDGIPVDHDGRKILATVFINVQQLKGESWTINS